MQVEIIKLTQKEDTSVDYDTTIFKVIMPDKVTLETSREYWILFKTLIDGGALKILLDFKNNGYIDSSGIGNLVRAAKLIRSNKGSISIANVNQEISDVFRMISLQNLINIFNTETEAVNSLRYINHQE